MAITIDLNEELPGQLQLTENTDYDSWPAMSIEVDDIHWCSAEPDVGIFSAYIDDYSTTGFIGDERITDMVEFATRVHAAIGKDCEESRDDIAGMLENRVTNAVDDQEPDDGYYEEN